MHIPQAMRVHCLFQLFLTGHGDLFGVFAIAERGIGPDRAIPLGSSGKVDSVPKSTFFAQRVTLLDTWRRFIMRWSNNGSCVEIGMLLIAIRSVPVLSIDAYQFSIRLMRDNHDACMACGVGGGCPPVCASDGGNGRGPPPL